MSASLSITVRRMLIFQTLCSDLPWVASTFLSTPSYVVDFSLMPCTSCKITVKSATERSEVKRSRYPQIACTERERSPACTVVVGDWPLRPAFDFIFVDQ